MRGLHLLCTLKWHLLDQILEDVNWLENLVNAAFDEFATSHEWHKHFYERTSKRIESARAEKILKLKETLKNEEVFHLLEMSEEKKSSLMRNVKERVDASNKKRNMARSRRNKRAHSEKSLEKWTAKMIVVAC